MRKLLAILLLVPSFAFAVRTIDLNEANTINFNQAFTAEFVAKKQVEAITKCSENVNSTINVVLYTPGGSISAGKLFFDTLRSLPCFFDTITIFSASMGYQTVQNLGKRYIIPSGTLMSHRASISGLSGEVGGELDKVLNLIKSEVEEMEQWAANRVGISLEQYKEEIRDELWMTAEEAVEKRHADEVVLVRCNESLMGSEYSTVNTFFGPISIEFSKCPIVTAPLSVKAGNFVEMEIRKYYSNLRKHSFSTL